MGVDDLALLLADVGGRPPPDLAPSADLRRDLGLDGVQLLALVGRLEHRAAIEFPPELVESLATVDDLLYYVDTVRAHSSGSPSSAGADRDA